MKISFPCGSCATVLEADAKATGQAVTCPKCGASVTVPPAKIGPGVTIGGFRIKKLIARGGMGEVYLAEQLSLGRDVALKILPPHFKSDPETVQRFLSEVRTAAKFQHPNLVTVYEAGEDNGVYFLAMAYIDGETLDSILERKGALPEAQALGIVEELASALAAAWQSHRLIHCDIKPGNIMLDRNGKPYLMDMGLSKLLAESTTAAESTEAFGTPNYVSPEQSFNEPNLDFRSDMFSLGMTLYHMLTGRLPFDAPTPAETLQKLDTETLPDPRTIVPGLSSGCVVLLERMLGRKPSSRYPDWETFLKACHRVRKSGKLLQAAMAPGESVLARTTGPATGVLPLKRGPQPLAPPQPVSHKSLALELAGLAVVLVLMAAVGYVYRDRLKKFFAKSELPAPPPPVVVVQTNAPAAPSVAAPAKTAPPTVSKEREQLLQKLFLETERHEREHPDDYELLLSRYRAIRKNGAGTVWADRAAIEIRRLQAAYQQALEEARSRLQTEVTSLLAQGKPEDAIAALRNYSGPFQKETEAERTAQADQMQAQLDRERLLATKIRPFLNAVAEELMRLDFPALKRRLAEAQSDPVLSTSPDTQPICEMAAKVAAMPETVLESFRRDVGKEVSLRTVRGETRGEIAGLTGDVVHVKKNVVIGGQVTGFVEEKYRIAEFTVDEWLRRLDGDSVEQKLMRGLLLWQTKAADKAREAFQQSGHPLGALLAVRVGDAQAAASQREKAMLEAASQTAYQSLLQLLGPDLATQPPEVLPGLIRRTPVPPAVRSKIQTALQAYWIQHGRTDWAQSHAEVLSALTEIGTKATRSIRVDENAFDRAIEQLRADNPGSPFHCRAVLEENGIVLSLRGSQRLVNLSALAGLPIKELNLSGCTRLADISPLANMPLEKLSLDDTLVEDLSPLHGMPLKELSLNRCKNIRDLRPLRDCPLEHLSVLDCPESLDLTPVRVLPGIKIDR